MIYRLPVLGYPTKIVQQIWYKAVRHTLQCCLSLCGHRRDLLTQHKLPCFIIQAHGHCRIQLSS